MLPLRFVVGEFATMSAALWPRALTFETAVSLGSSPRELQAGMIGKQKDCDAEVIAAVREVLNGREIPDRCEVLHRRSWGRGVLLRVKETDGAGCIVKAWAVRGARERLKAMLMLDSASHEWKMHRRAQKLGVAVPEPQFRNRLRSENGVTYELVGVEDLGATQTGVAYIKTCLARGDLAAIRQFEDTVIGILGKLVAARFVDVDNQLNNYLVTSEGAVYRIDFECCRRFCFNQSRSVVFANMLERLIRSHVHAVHPHSDYSAEFVRRLWAALGPSQQEVDHISQLLSRELIRERRKVEVGFQMPEDCWHVSEV